MQYHLTMKNKNHPKYNPLRYTLYLISIVACIALLSVYTILELIKPNALNLFAVLGGFLQQIIPEIFSVLLVFIVLYYIVDKKGIKIKESLEEEIVQLLEKLNTLSNDIDRDLNDVKKDVDYLKEKANISTELFSIVNKRNSKIQDLMSTANASHPFVGKYYKFIMKTYHDVFDVNSNGFLISNEQICLLVYCYFWEYLINQQKQRRKENSQNLIVRVVHSNSIAIWVNDDKKYELFNNRLLKLQKEFIEYGGIVVRILIGSDPIPNEDYRKVIANMAEFGIECKYLQKNGYTPLNYDFAILLDEKMTLKWVSDAAGDSLSGMEVRDEIEKEATERWDDFFEELEMKGDPIKSIPLNRQYFMDKGQIKNY